MVGARDVPYQNRRDNLVLMWSWAGILIMPQPTKPAPILGLSDIQVEIAVVGKNVELRGGFEGNVLFEACTDPDLVDTTPFSSFQATDTAEMSLLAIESQRIFPLGQIFPSRMFGCSVSSDEAASVAVGDFFRRAPMKSRDSLMSSAKINFCVYMYQFNTTF